MASVYFHPREDIGRPAGWLDYSMQDGAVFKFEYEGKTWYDDSEDIALAGWREKLSEAVVSYGMNVDYGDGLNAFVLPLVEAGLVEVKNLQ